MNDSLPSSDSPAGLYLPPGVTRHEYGRTRGFLVRIPARGEGAREEVRRLFSDGVHGGKEEAHRAALSFWQDTRTVERPKRRVPGYGYVRRALRRYRTASGELREYDAFVAVCWDQEGRMRSTNWSVDAHGEERAEAECERWLAEQQRLAREGDAGELARAG